MPKVCSQKTCKREVAVDSKYKLCIRCREMRKKSKRKRKEKASTSVPEDGHRYCKQCFRQWPLDQFESKYKTCTLCRESKKKSKRKRKEKASTSVPKDGHRYCKNCSRQWPLSHFESIVNRRKESTALCATCRSMQTEL